MGADRASNKKEKVQHCTSQTPGAFSKKVIAFFSNRDSWKPVGADVHDPAGCCVDVNKNVHYM